MGLGHAVEKDGIANLGRQVCVRPAAHRLNIVGKSLITQHFAFDDFSIAFYYHGRPQHAWPAQQEAQNWAAR